MKHKVRELFFAVLVLLPFTSLAQLLLKGVIVTDTKEPIEKATVSLLKGGKSVGCVRTASDGCFVFQVSDGTYTLDASVPGYCPHIQEVKMYKSDNDLSDIIMRKNLIELDEVLVRSGKVRYEHNKYILSVDNTPLAIGRNGLDLLRLAPGVSVSGNGLSVNGKSGTMVFVDDRELEMSDENLLSYIQSLSAENVESVEVIPLAGVKYDAEATGGIVKFVMKKMQRDGVRGNAGLEVYYRHPTYSFSPDVALSFKKKRFLFNVNGMLLKSPLTEGKSAKNTSYTNRQLEMNTDNKSRYRELESRIGTEVFFELNPNHVIGVGAEYYANNSDVRLSTQTSFVEDGAATDATDGFFRVLPRLEQYNIRFNYVGKLDTVGSEIKLIAGCTIEENGSKVGCQMTTASLAGVSDSIFRNHESGSCRVFNVSFDGKKVFSDRWVLGAGAKFTSNHIVHQGCWDYADGDQWVQTEDCGKSQMRDEKITAVYADAQLSLGRFLFDAGVRGEYASVNRGKAHRLRNNFNLFPQLSVTWNLNSEKSRFLTLDYSGNINRPAFDELNPMRELISDYLYFKGPSYLKSAILHNLSLVANFNSAFSVRADYTDTSNGVAKYYYADPADENVRIQSFMNMKFRRQLTIAFTGSYDPCGWLSFMANVWNHTRWQRLSNDSPLNRYNVFDLSCNATVVLPLDFYIGVEGFWQTPVKDETYRISSYFTVDLSVKKKFGKHWTASLSTEDLLQRKIRYTACANDFKQVTIPLNRLALRCSVTYKFSCGKKLRTLSIEDNIDSSRMEKRKR